MFNLFSRFVLICVCLFCVATAHAHNKVVVVPLGGDEAPEAPIYSLGDTGPGGGTVFHVTDGGLHGMEYAPIEDWIEATWGCEGINVSESDDLVFPSPISIEDSGNGFQNTTAMLKECVHDNPTQLSAPIQALSYSWPTAEIQGAFIPDADEALLLLDYLYPLLPQSGCTFDGEDLSTVGGGWGCDEGVFIGENSKFYLIIMTSTEAVNGNLVFVPDKNTNASLFVDGSGISSQISVFSDLKTQSRGVALVRRF